MISYIFTPDPTLPHKVDPKVVVVEGHGNEKGFVDNRDGTPKPITPEQVAALVEAAPNYSPEKPVEVRACETGKRDDGPAAALSEKLPNEVRAPTTITITTVTIDSTGKVAGSTTKVDTGGRYRSFKDGMPFETQQPQRNTVPRTVSSK